MLAEWLIGATSNINNIPDNTWITVAKIKVIFTEERLPSGSTNSLRITMDNGYWVGTEEHEVYCEETDTTVSMSSDSSKDFKKEDFSLNEDTEYTLVLRIKYLTGKPVNEKLLQTLVITGPALTKVTEFGIIPIEHPAFTDMVYYVPAYSKNLSFITSDGPIGIINMNVTFMECSSLNSSLANWNVSQVTDFAGCFRECTLFNNNIIGWNVHSAANMDNMFYNSPSFNQNLSSWYVPLIGSTPTDFSTGASAWVLPKPQWGVSPP